MLQGRSVIFKIAATSNPRKETYAWKGFYIWQNVSGYANSSINEIKQHFSQLCDTFHNNLRSLLGPTVSHLMSPDKLFLCNIPSNVSKVLKGLRHTQINAGNAVQWQICGEVSISDSYMIRMNRSLWLHKGHFRWWCALNQSLVCYCTIVWLVDWVTPTLNVILRSHFSLTNTAASCYASNKHKEH